MRIYNAVQTEKKALELVKKFNHECRAQRITLRCACGETPGYMAKDGPGTAFVAVCDACGDDNQDNVVSII